MNERKRDKKGNQVQHMQRSNEFKVSYKKRDVWKATNVRH